MTRPTRITLSAATVLGVVLVLAGASFYVAIWRPNRLLLDEVWCSNASTNELRDLCHHVISRRLGVHHDAFLYLRHVGDAASVPLLIRALEWQNPDRSGPIVCTTNHCVDALRSLTGEDFGYSLGEWKRWWEETGSTLAPDQFHPRDLDEKGDKTAAPLTSGR